MNPFRRASMRYGRTPEPETPYQKAAQVWDERIGSARVQAKNWRLMAFGSLILSAGLSFALVWQSLSSTIVPWVVQVDKFGEAQAVAPAIADYRPTDPQVAWHLARFIEQVRAIPADAVIVRQNWLRAYEFTTDRGAASLNDYARANDPFAKVSKRQVAIEVSSVIRASPDSFRVAWTERAYENGQLAATERWTAILTIAVQQPRDADRLKENPLGIYVNAINWSKDGTVKPPFHKAAAPALAISRSALVRTSAIPALLIGIAALGGCAQRIIPPDISYDDMTPAVQMGDPPAPVEVVELPKPLPLPGQLKPVPGTKSPPEAKDPKQRIAQANAAARVQPVRYGFINAVQVYPFSSGALYQVYAAPGQVTDVALQPGEQLVGSGPVAAGDTVRWIIAIPRAVRARPSGFTFSSSRPGRTCRPTSSSTPTAAPISSNCARPRRPIWRRSPGSIRRTSSSRSVARTPRRSRRNPSPPASTFRR
jgi:type IV secretion system protein TrbF